jgi:hypothetical protein
LANLVPHRLSPGEGRKEERKERERLSTYMKVLNGTYKLIFGFL